MEGVPVSVEEPRPGSLCDLTSCMHSLLSRADPSTSLSLSRALRWPPTTVEDEVGGVEEGGRAPWCDGVGGLT